MLPLLNFTTLLQNMAASVQGGAAQLIDLSVGSVLRALLEACAGVALWMQWLILQVLAMTRAATSTGAALDSWMADFSFARLPGAAAVGDVGFSRYTAGITATVPVGTVVTTNDGTQSFTVVADPTDPAWNGNGGYTLGATTTSIIVPVQAVTPGGAGNVQPGTIGLIGSAIPGVDTVTNAQAFGGGVDPESDAAFRARFLLYINSRSLATPLAVENAVAGLQEGLRYTVLENVDTEGVPTPGNFVVVVDDGTGFPPAPLLTNASAAVEVVRPIGATYAVVGPVVVMVTVAIAVVTSNPQTALAVATNIQANVLSWIAQLPIGGTLAISKIDAIAHNTDPSVMSVTGTTINGAPLDVAAPDNGVLIAASVAVN